MSRSDRLPDDDQPPGFDWTLWVVWLYWLLTLACLPLAWFVNVVFVLLFMIMALFGWGMLGPWRRSRRRLNKVAEFAQENGFRYKQEAGPADLKELPPLPLFQRGKNPRARNVMIGKRDGVPFVFLDFRYIHTFSMKAVRFIAAVAGIDVGDEGEHPIEQTVVVFPKLARRLPDFLVLPRGLLNKTMDRLREKVPDLEIGKDEHDDFARLYYVEGEQPAQVRRAFDEDVMDFFADNPDWFVESHQGLLAIYKAGFVVKPENCDKRLDKSLEFLRVLTRTSA